MLADRIDARLMEKRLREAEREREYVLGPAVVSRTDMAWGKSSEEFNPAIYGNYIATSNGVYACATGRAQLLASLPLCLYKLNASGKRTEVTAGKLYTLLQKVNPFWTVNRAMEMTELSLCLWGECFWFLERGENMNQAPREMWWGRPDRVRVFPDPVNYIKGFSFQPLNSNTAIPFAPQEVIWMRFANPIDEFEGLSPLAAARLAADYASGAMQSNRNLFVNGIQAGGVVTPKQGTTLKEEQAREIERILDKRMQGVDKAHRWSVFRFEAEMKALGFNPKEAEFLGGMKLALEDICRAYKWPQDLVGGQRTYENYDAAMRGAWTHCVLPEATFIAAELTEQLLPMFPGEADEAEFNSEGVEVLREHENEEWTRVSGQIEKGAIVVNEWRTAKGMKPVPWGDAWWAPLTVAPIRDGNAPAVGGAAGTVESGGGRGEGGAWRVERGAWRVIEYGGIEHQRLWERFVKRTTKQEKRLGTAVAGLFKRQKDAVIARLKGRSQKSEVRSQNEPFDMAEWIRKFRVELRAILKEIIGEGGDGALDDLDIGLTFDVDAPAVLRFLEQRAQRFAREVNETTWQMLKDALTEGIDAGEGLNKLIDRVEAVMGERIASSEETIARTEVIGAMNGGTLEAWKQSGVVEAKTWLAALDNRTRESHVEAHGQTVKLDEDFHVGGGDGPAPGQIGEPEEDINCRCSMTAVVSERGVGRGAWSVERKNGHQKEQSYA